MPGSRAPSQRPHSTAARLVCLAKGEGGLWRRVIAGQKPACIAGRGTTLSLSGRLDSADRARMRPFRSSLVTIALGLGVLGISLVRIWGDVGHTAFALFLAAVILVELFEESDRERAREPMQWERFRLAAAVQIAAIIMLGPWAGALVAAAGLLAGGMFRGRALRNVAFDYLTARALLLDVVRGRETFDPRLVSSTGEVGLGATLALLAIGHPWDVTVVIPVAIAVQQVQLRLKSLQRETLRALETFANIVDERDPSTMLAKVSSAR